MDWGLRGRAAADQRGVSRLSGNGCRRERCQWRRGASGCGSQWEECLTVGPVVGRLFERLREFQRGFLLTSVHLGHQRDPDFSNRIGLLGFDVCHDLEQGRNGGNACAEILEYSQ